MKAAIKFLILILSLIALVLLLNKHFPNALTNDQNKVSLISSITIITLMISRISVSNIKLSSLLGQISAWIFISLIALTGYSYKLELKQFASRLSANIIPGYGQINDDGTITFFAGGNGHFTITGLVNDVSNIDFMLDTGASVVSLTARDAEAIGIDTSKLEYNSPASTANGISWGAKITLDKIQIGSIIIHDVPASVSQEGALDTSLLGMSFLKRLKQFQIQENKLTLTN